MEASAGDDRDPGDLGAHRPAAPTAAASAGGGRGGEARAAWGSRRDREPSRQPAPRGFLAAAAQLSAAGGSAARCPRPRSPAPVYFPPPPQVADQGQTAAAATAEALRQAGPER